MFAYRQNIKFTPKPVGAIHESPVSKTTNVAQIGRGDQRSSAQNAMIFMNGGSKPPPYDQNNKYRTHR